jgi:ATP-binding cassette subfamily B (MDR/TAP) protein 1
MRLKFFQSVMRQDIQWFDKNKAGTLTTKLSDGIDRIKDGIGDKTGVVITFFVQFIGGMIVAFTFSWKLSLVMLGILPFMLIVIGGLGLISKIFIKKEQEGTAAAGAIAEELVNGIRTVIAFNGQEKETTR